MLEHIKIWCLVFCVWCLVISDNTGEYNIFWHKKITRIDYVQLKRG